MNNFIFAFLLTLLAGLSTLIGGLIAFLPRKSNGNFLSVSLGFSAGVMIYVSFVEIFFKAKQNLISHTNNFIGLLITSIAFFCGIFLTIIIEKLIPNQEKNLKNNYSVQSKKMLKTGTIVALAITIHNFPEGLASFISALEEPNIAIPIATYNNVEALMFSVPQLFAGLIVLGIGLVVGYKLGDV